jgi:non-haem Fe2+, alpha-ketoglutarate-dependent halogenase
MVSKMILEAGTSATRRFALSKEELDKFNEDGFAGPFTLYQPDEMAEHMKALRPKLLNNRKSIYRGEEGLSGVTNLSNYDRHFDVGFLADHICRPEIVERLASIVGPDIVCWRTEFFPKYPGDEGTDWHQAANFANVTASKKPQIEWPDGAGFQGTLTVWTAFTDCTIENGCLQLMPGTHRVMNYDESKIMTYDDGMINHVEKNGVRRGFFGYDYRQLQKDPGWSPDESRARSMCMKAGQFIIFWSTLMHASHPHSGASPEMRLAYSARYVPTVVKVYPYSDSLDEFGGKASLEGYGCVLVSGEDHFHHNKFTQTTVEGMPFKTLRL